MSATCPHAVADAWDHLECPGCARVRAKIARPPKQPLSLLDRDPTPDDVEAERDLPRPGVWAGEVGADLRRLTQDETDQIIRGQLCMLAQPDELERVQAACGDSGARTRPVFTLASGTERTAWHQRGGIDSDPLVRVLAHRAWGDRDRLWFELRTARARDAVRVLHTRHAWRLRR